MLSPDLKSRVEGFIGLHYFGNSYYVPITKKIRRLAGLPKPKKGKWAIPYRQESDLEDYLQDVVSAVYFQMRETIGDEVYSRVHSEIQETFEEMFSDRLAKKVGDTLNKVAPVTMIEDKTKEDKKC